MTQTLFAPPPTAAPAVEEQSAGGSRRTLLVAGGLVAALALGGGGYVLMSGGSDAPASAPIVHFPPSGAKAKAPASKTTTTAAKPPTIKVPAVSTVPLGRDPFHALYIAPAAAAASTGTNTTPASGTSTTPASGTTAPTTTTPKPVTYKLTLTKVSGTGSDMSATFSVGGRLMVAKVGSVFGPTSELKLLDLTKNTKGVWVATLQVGDSEPFDAPKGATLYVS